MGKRNIAGLYEYGIQTEDSDIRAHVSFVNQGIYVYETQEGLVAIEKHSPPTRSAYQPGYPSPTAEGWLVRPEWINGLVKVSLGDWSNWNCVDTAMSTSVKGRWAMKCVCAALRAGKFPLWIKASEEEDRDIQISGADLVVHCEKKIQVKCDYSAGEKPHGTGNLFLQYAEINPLRMV